MTVITGNNLKKQINQSKIFWFYSFSKQKAVFVYSHYLYFRLDQKMLSNRFCVLFEQKRSMCRECVDTRVHYGDTLNLSLSTVCSSAAGTSGAAHLSSQSVLRATATMILIGSHHQSPRSEIKDKEVLARALILLMSRRWAQALCRFETPCRTGTHVSASVHVFVDRGRFKWLHGICMYLCDMTQFCVCVCV